jgi:Protein of unknown function (DUF1064)
MAPRAHKYGAKKVEVDGHKFPSKAEATRYLELKILQRGGMIFDLKLQPEFPLVVNGIKIGKYIADFSYTDQTGRHVVEDVKSPATRTREFIIKKKLVLALHGIDVIEVRRS